MPYLINGKDTQVSLAIFFRFLLLAPFITLVHESGHWLWAYYCNLEPVLHFGMVTYENLPESKPYSEAIKQKLHYASIGGPLQNMMLGTMGFIVFLKLVSVNKLSYPLTEKEWLLIFISLLWTRQVYIALFGIIYIFLNLDYPVDEVWIADYWAIPDWAIYLPTGAVGSAIGLTILYYFPREYRVHFIIGGGSGSLAGMGLWYWLIGPMLLP